MACGEEGERCYGDVASAPWDLAAGWAVGGDEGGEGARGNAGAVGLVDAVGGAAVGYSGGSCGLEGSVDGVEGDLYVLDWAFYAFASEVPDLDAAVSAGCCEDAVCCAWLKSDLFERCGMVAEN